MGIQMIFIDRKKLIIQSYVMDGEKRMVLSFGCYKTVGEMNGEKQETLE